MNQRRCFAAFAAVVVFALAAPTQAALVGLWTFDGNANDSSGYGNHGALLNGATIVADDANGGGGGSLEINGGSGHVLVPHHPTLNIVGQGTFAAWVRPIGNVQWDGVIAKNPSSNGSGLNHAGNYELRIENGSRVPTLLYQQGGVDGTTSVAGNTALADNAWTHVAVTTTASGSATFYLNGAATNSAGLNQHFGATNFNPLFIGNRADLFTVLNGRLDDVAIFDTVLTPGQIGQIMGGNFTGFSGIAQDSRIVQGVVATASSELVGGPFDRAAAYAVNGAGFNPATGTHGNSFEDQHWLTNFGDTAPQITFDLGSVRTLSEMRIWNYNETDAVDLTTRGLNNVTVQVSNDGVSYVNLFNTTFLEAPGVTNIDYHQTIPLNTTTRFVRFTNLTTHGDSLFGLSEVQFLVAQIPEPSTAIFAVLGAGGLLARRRRSAC